MAKRSEQVFKRHERDFYKTPLAAVIPLLPHLNPQTMFIEPCAGDGALLDILIDYNHEVIDAVDIEPQRNDICFGNAIIGSFRHKNFDCFITNPPWDRNILHLIIENLSNQAPTWLLFDADWIHTKQAKPYLNRLVKVVSIGRVKWFPETKQTGKDNCAWYLFDKPRASNIIQFVGR